MTTLYFCLKLKLFLRQKHCFCGTIWEEIFYNTAFKTCHFVLFLKLGKRFAI
jgi:hypothetical protein